MLPSSLVEVFLSASINHRLGKGVPVDGQVAVGLYRLAAEKPHSYKAAQRQLGVMYFDGVIVPQSYHDAVKWFQLATQQDELGVRKIAALHLDFLFK